MKENNELIARFMNDSIDNPYQYDMYWNCLIPVVEKIESLGFSVLIIGNYCRVQRPHPYKEFDTDICESKIEAVTKAIIEFIQWYNTTKQQEQTPAHESQDVKPGEL